MNINRPVEDGVIRQYESGLQINTEVYFVASAACQAVMSHAVSLGGPIPLLSIASLAVVSASGAGLYKLITRYNYSFILGICYSTMLWYSAPFCYLPFVDKYIGTVSSISEMAGALTVVSVMSIIGAFFGSVFRYSIAATVDVFRRLPAVQIFAVCVPFVAVKIVLIVLGIWGYGSLNAQGEADSVPDILIFISTASQPIAPMLALYLGLRRCAAADAPRLSAFSVILIAMLIAVELMFWLPMGRRLFAALVVISLILHLASSQQGGGRRSLVKWIILLPLTFVGTYQAWKIFYALRVGSWISGSDGSSTRSAVELINLAKEANEVEVQSNFFLNIASRPFIIDSFAQIKDAMSGFLYGSHGATQIIQAMPRIILTDKDGITEYFGGVGEDLWAQKLGTPLNDWANSIALDAYVDFGLAGAPVYFVGLAFMFILVDKVAVFTRSPLARVYCWLLMVASINQIENSTTGMLNVARTAVLMCGALYLYSTIFGRSTHANSAMRPSGQI